MSRTLELIIEDADSLEARFSVGQYVTTDQGEEYNPVTLETLATTKAGVVLQGGGYHFIITNLAQAMEHFRMDSET